MKLNKKFFTVKSYKCNISSMKDIRTIFFFGVICFSMLMILTGCNNSEQTNTSQPDKTVSETKLETQIITKAKNRSLEIANFYKSIYAHTLFHIFTNYDSGLCEYRKEVIDNLLLSVR